MRIEIFQNDNLIGEAVDIDIQEQRDNSFLFDEISNKFSGITIGPISIRGTLSHINLYSTTAKLLNGCVFDIERTDGSYITHIQNAYVYSDDGIVASWTADRLYTKVCGPEDRFRLLLM